MILRLLEPLRPELFLMGLLSSWLEETSAGVVEGNVNDSTELVCRKAGSLLLPRRISRCRELGPSGVF